MVAQNTQNDLHAFLLQRLQIFFPIIEQVLHVLIVVVVHLASFYVIVDVSREENHLVDDEFTRLLQRIAEIMKRIGIVHLYATDNLQATFLVTVGHFGDVTHDEHELALVLRHLSGALHAHGNGVDAVLLQLFGRSIFYSHLRRLHGSGSHLCRSTHLDELLGQGLDVGSVNLIVIFEGLGVIHQRVFLVGSGSLRQVDVEIDGAFLVEDERVLTTVAVFIGDKSEIVLRRPIVTFVDAGHVYIVRTGSRYGQSCQRECQRLDTIDIHKFHVI